MALFHWPHPMTLMKLCRSPGCPEVAEPGGNRCADHAVVRHDVEAARKATAKLRPEALAGARLYNNRRWRKAAKGHLEQHPLCVACQACGIVTAAREVDHIQPHHNDYYLGVLTALSVIVRMLPGTGLGVN